MKYSELIEKRRHGTSEFPVEHYYIDKTHPRYVMALHWHKEFEIIKVRSGRLTVFLNNTCYELARGDCLFVEGGCLKRGYPSENCVYECLVFDTSMLERSAANYGEPVRGAEKLEYINLISRSDEEILALTDELFSAVAEPRPFCELETVGLLYRLFALLYRGGYIKESKAVSRDRGLSTVISLLQWIDAHCTERISLERISELTHLSPKYICRIFKEYTSKTVIEYVNECRVERACTELIKGGITDAAFSSGFNDLSYFCKTFKKYKNMSPSEYKRVKNSQNA